MRGCEEERRHAYVRGDESTEVRERWLKPGFVETFQQATPEPLFWLPKACFSSYTSNQTPKGYIMGA